MSCFTFDSLFSNSICLVSPGQNKEVEQPVLASHFLLFQLTLFTTNSTVDNYQHCFGREDASLVLAAISDVQVDLRS